MIMVYSSIELEHVFITTTLKHAHTHTHTHTHTYTTHTHTHTPHTPCTPLHTHTHTHTHTQGLFSDVCFLVEGVVVPAHRLVLTTRCEVMSAMLSGAFQESTANEVGRHAYLNMAKL